MYVLITQRSVYDYKRNTKVYFKDMKSGAGESFHLDYFVQVWIHFTLGLRLKQHQRELRDRGCLGLIQDEWRCRSRGLPSRFSFTDILHVNAIHRDVTTVLAYVS